MLDHSLEVVRAAGVVETRNLGQATVGPPQIQRHGQPASSAEVVLKTPDEGGPGRAGQAVQEQQTAVGPGGSVAFQPQPVAVG